MSVPPQILFVSHDASATGAPNSLLNFLDWNVRHQKCRFRVLLLDGGPLQEEFAKRGPTTVIRQDDVGLIHLLFRTWAKVRRALGRTEPSNPRWPPSRLEQSRVDSCLAGFKADLIYINSVAAAPVFACLKRLDVPVLTFLREMKEEVDRAHNTGWFDTLAERTKAFIAISEAARRQIVIQHALPAEKFTVINPFIDTGKLQSCRKVDSRAALIKRARLNQADFIVAGCGTTNWRKGSNLFIAIARTYFENMGNDRTVFIWIGGLKSQGERLQVTHDIRLAGLEGRVIFIGEHLDAATLLAGADILALTSREEPFARVMLEAGLGRCPVVCFENSGGAPEFTAVPYLSINAFAAAVQQLRQNEALRATLGDSAYRTVLHDHDVEGGAVRVFAVVETLLSRTEPTPSSSSNRDSVSDDQSLP